MRKFLVIVALLALAACKTASGGYPSRADVEALVAARPKIPPQALADPSIDAKYRSEKRDWEDGIVTAGRRVCLFLQRSGMAVDCS